MAAATVCFWVRIEEEVLQGEQAAMLQRAVEKWSYAAPILTLPFLNLATCRQRVARLFRVEVKYRDYKISESSLATELAQLQQTAAFLFGAGLISNFLTGAPWSTDVIKSTDEWLRSANATALAQQHNVALSSADGLLTYSLQASMHFKGLWGACMLLTFASVVLAHFASTTLFSCWSLAKNGIEGIVKRTNKSESKGSPSDCESPFVANQEARYPTELEREQLGWARIAAEEAYDTQCKGLTSVNTSIAVSISLSRFLFSSSLMLWLCTITYAVLELYRLHHRAGGAMFRALGFSFVSNGATMLVFAVVFSLGAWVAYAVLLSKVWDMYLVFHAESERKAFVDRIMLNISSSVSSQMWDLPTKLTAGEPGSRILAVANSVMSRLSLQSTASRLQTVTHYAL